MSQRIAHPSSYVQLFDRWSVSSHTAVSSLLVHCCLVLPHTQDSFRQTMYNGFTATASVSDRDQSMSASLLDLSYFTMLVFILLIHCVSFHTDTHVSSLLVLDLVENNLFFAVLHQRQTSFKCRLRPITQAETIIMTVKRAESCQIFILLLGL